MFLHQELRPKIDKLANIFYYIEKLIFPKDLYMFIHNNSHKYIKRQIHMNNHRSKVLKFLKEREVVNSSELARYLKISWNTAEKYLLELVIEGKVKRIKKTGGSLWMLK